MPVTSSVSVLKDASDVRALTGFSGYERKMLTRYAGAVLKINKGVTVQVMSDIWGSEDQAFCWDDTLGRPVVIGFAGTEYSYSRTDTGHAEVDYTPEVLAKYEAYLFQHYLTKFTDEAISKAQVPARGKTVKVYKGRTAKGMVGPAVGTFESSYRAGWRTNIELKVGIAKDDETVTVNRRDGTPYEKHVNVEWVWARNVEVLDYEKHVDPLYVAWQAKRNTVYDLRAKVAAQVKVAA